MRKFLSLLLALAMIMSLGVAAFAQTGDKYTMYIEGAEKTVYKGDEKASLDDGGACNSKLYRLLNTDVHDRSLFASMSIEFEDVDEDYFRAGKQVLAGNNGYTYENSNAEVVFLDSAGKYHATGLGEAEIVVFDPDGNEVDRFTVSVTGAKSNYIIKAACTKCGENMGTSMHILSCGHFVCEGDGAPKAHAAGVCGHGGHYVCDGLDHATCSNCLSPMCFGEHGVGVCEHVHNWFYANSANYWPYREPGVPMRICTTCGATEYAWWMLPKPDHGHHGRPDHGFDPDHGSKPDHDSRPGHEDSRPDHDSKPGHEDSRPNHDSKPDHDSNQDKPNKPTKPRATTREGDVLAVE